MDQKQCRTCSTVKPVSEFHPNPNDMPGYRPDCKVCYRRKRRDRYKTQEGKDVPYAQLLAREYDMTLDEYYEMLRSQNGVCAICKQPETNKHAKTGEPYRLNVDHDHTTGKTRGLLCFRCNRLMGWIDKDQQILPLIAEYLRKFGR